MSDAGGWVEVLRAEDVTDEVLEAVDSIHDGWYSSGRIDWQDFLERMEGVTVAGGRIDLGNDTASPAIAAIKAHVRQLRKQSEQ